MLSILGLLAVIIIALGVIVLVLALESLIPAAIIFALLKLFSLGNGISFCTVWLACSLTDLLFTILFTD